MNELEIGTVCDAKDHCGNWYEARVLAFDDKDGDVVKVHFVGWSSLHDEWIFRAEIKPLHTHSTPWRQHVKAGSLVALKKAADNKFGLAMVVFRVGDDVLLSRIPMGWYQRELVDKIVLAPAGFVSNSKCYLVHTVMKLPGAEDPAEDPAEDVCEDPSIIWVRPTVPLMVEGGPERRSVEYRPLDLPRVLWASITDGESVQPFPREVRSREDDQELRAYFQNLAHVCADQFLANNTL